MHRMAAVSYFNDLSAPCGGSEARRSCAEQLDQLLPPNADRDELAKLRRANR
jgi:hypothetical protein